MKRSPQWMYNTDLLELEARAWIHHACDYPTDENLAAREWAIMTLQKAQDMPLERVTVH